MLSCEFAISDVFCTIKSTIPAFLLVLESFISKLIVFALGRMFETHTAELAPSVRELAEMEFKAQTSFLSLQHRDWRKH